ncbi:MAG TPA: hypothetical protein PLJ25_08280, partial [Methanothrix sp.]|nr:hypothetical protein [Methanothrix sp.]
MINLPAQIEGQSAMEKNQVAFAGEAPSPWSLWVVGSIGFFFGPVSAALITYFNFKRMGMPEKAKWTIG